MVVGLGNPGKKYEITRHNAGFLACDLLCDKYGVRAKNLRHRALYTSCVIDGKQVVIVKPQTYMNLSGEAVRDMSKAFGVPPQRIIVIFDDASLVPGRVRVRRSGTDGGHNGIKSIIYQLESDAFPRIKIGVGAPNRAEEGMADYVLSPMDSDCMAAVRLCPQIVETIITSGIDAAMQMYNSTAKKE